MYELRRTYVTQPGKERLVASILQKMGTLLVNAGMRNPFHISFNSGTCPGEKQRVHVTWTSETLKSPMRAGNQYPVGYAELQQQRGPHVTDTWLEIHELMNPDKMIDES